MRAPVEERTWTVTVSVAPLHPNSGVAFPPADPSTTEVLPLPSIPYGDTMEAVCRSRLSSLASDSVSLMSPTPGDSGRV